MISNEPKYYPDYTELSSIKVGDILALLRSICEHFTDGADSEYAVAPLNIDNYFYLQSEFAKFLLGIDKPVLQFGNYSNTDFIFYYSTDYNRFTGKLYYAPWDYNICAINVDLVNKTITINNSIGSYDGFNEQVLSPAITQPTYLLVLKHYTVNDVLPNYFYIDYTDFDNNHENGFYDEKIKLTCGACAVSSVLPSQNDARYTALFNALTTTPPVYEFSVSAEGAVYGSLSADTETSRFSFCPLDIVELIYGIQMTAGDFVAYDYDSGFYCQQIQSYSCASSSVDCDDCDAVNAKFDYILKLISSLGVLWEKPQDQEEEDEMDYTQQLQAITNAILSIDSRLHTTALVEEQETDVNITQAIIDNTESLDDVASRPIITTNEDLSPWSNV